MKIILIKYGELTTKSGNRNLFINILYNNIKKALENYNVKIIKNRVRMFVETDDNIDEIYAWLLNQPNFRKLYIDNNDEFYYNCVFTSASYISGSTNEGYGIYGIKATMKCDSTFMWKEVEYTYTSAELLNIVTHENISNVRESTYPTLIIKTGSTGGNITVQNVSDNNRLTTFTRTLANDTITLSYYPALVNSYLNDNDELVYESFNKKFFRLLQGTNKIGIVGDISEITLKYKIGRLVR